LRASSREPAISSRSAGVWKTAEELTPHEFEQAFRVNALGLLVAAQQRQHRRRRCAR
jgi:hypothetical protein